ncbi:MAG: hypothetical protein L0Z50_30560 [Verrucomicrobiales bacterium]|nr:hypothetical protein [Verrucomicrobiales bacterium]
MLLTIAAVALIGPRPLALNLAPSWRWSNPWPHGNNIVDMIETNGVVIQVCDRGQIYSSVDLTNWVTRPSHTSKALRSICFFKDQFVISGENGTIVTGNSALEFQTNSLGTADWLEGITASPSLVVAVGDNGAIYTSADAVLWQRQSVTFTKWLRSVAFGRPRNQATFVLVGEQGFVATSNDASQWNAGSIATSEDLNRVAWVNGQFLVVGNTGTVFTSADGKTWSEVGGTGATGTLNAIAGATGSTLIAGDGELRLREGGGSWSDALSFTNSFPAPSGNYLSALHGGASYLVGGRTGLLVEGFKTNATSETVWLPFTASVRNWLWDVKHFPSAYITVGDAAAVLTSLDGFDWAQEFVPPTVGNAVFLGVGGRTNLAVAVGSGGTIMLSHDTFVPVVSTNLDGTLVTNQVSTLGIIWDHIQPSPTTEDLQGVTAFGNQLVVTGGTGTILTSTDGTNWQKRVTPTSAFLSSIEASSTGLVTVGKNGVILTSPDTITWTQRVAPITDWIYRVRRFSERWIAVGQNGTILTSADGTSWTSRASGTTSWLNDVILVGDTYFAIGNQGTVLASSDAIDWTSVGTMTGKSLYGATSHDGRLVVVGVEGVILRSQITPMASPVIFVRYPVDATQNLFLFGGERDQRFTLDRSTNLIDWLIGPTLEITDPTGTLIHEDTGANASMLQFFRAKGVP